MVGRDVSQDELGELAGFARGSMSHWENGVRRPSRNAIGAFVKLFHEHGMDYLTEAWIDYGQGEGIPSSRPSAIQTEAVGMLYRFGRIIIPTLWLLACTSLGQAGRAKPLIEKPVSGIHEIGFDGDDNELAVGVERLLDQAGVTVKILQTPRVRETAGNKVYIYDEVQTRYVIRVESNDGDRCIPEGSRQMSFAITVTDYEKQSRVLLMRGEHACRDTILRNFEQWLAKATQ